MEISPSCYLSTKFITTVQGLETNQKNTGTGPEKLGFHQQILDNLSIPLVMTNTLLLKMAIENEWYHHHSSTLGKLRKKWRLRNTFSMMEVS